MKARKQRQLSEAEQKARAKRGGKTRREFNALHSKFANKQPAPKAGSFEVVAMFDGNIAPQTAPFPNIAAAVARFERLSTNPNVLNLKVVEHKLVYDRNGQPAGTRAHAVFSLVKLGQEFANSKIDILWKRKGHNSIISDKSLRTMVKENPAIAKAAASGEYEVHKYVAVGGEPWWERRA